MSAGFVVLSNPAESNLRFTGVESLVLLAESLAVLLVASLIVLLAESLDVLLAESLAVLLVQLPGTEAC